MACSVLAFAAIAIPLGIRVSRLETYANLALALGLAMAYYLSMVLITWLEGFPLLRPDLLVWIPNVILIGLGLLLLQRMNKH
jgi:lipopolysaccharide export system permease protein